MCDRLFFKLMLQNKECIQAHCSNRRNPLHFACRKWYLCNNPQC